MKVADEIVIASKNRGHAPEIRVMARSRDGHELVRASYYYTSHEDSLGRYRRRRKATVRWKKPGEDYEAALILWEGAYAGTKMERCPHLRALARAMGVDRATFLEAVSRGRTVLFGELAGE